MYLLLKYVPTNDFTSRRNSLLSSSSPRHNDIVNLFELRVEFTNAYSQFSSCICGCNLKTKDNVFEVYRQPYPPTEKNRQMYDEHVRYQKTTNPYYNPEYTPSFDYWLLSLSLHPVIDDKCPLCYTLCDTTRGDINRLIDILSNKHVLILELPNAAIGTVVYDLVYYARCRYGPFLSQQNGCKPKIPEFKQEYNRLLDDILICNTTDPAVYVPVLLAYQKDKWIQHTQKYVQTMLLPETEQKLHRWKQEVCSEPTPKVYEPEDELNLESLD
tara:strand:+ start:310 stop:1122 length:813 start_codon:yes stop_codon:yes gene_type:complete